jgi:hypothetical protein
MRFLAAKTEGQLGERGSPREAPEIGGKGRT